MRAPNTFFLSLAWWLASFQVLRCAKVCLAWGNLFSLFLVGSKSNVSAVFWLRFRMVWALLGTILLYFFLFSGFQKRRFSIFLAAVSQWLGHKTCQGSAFSHARPKHLFLEFGLVACRLFLCFYLYILVGSKSNVSAVFWLRFRMVWALYFFLFNGFQKRRFGIFPAAVSQWLGHKTCWGSAFSHARPKHLFLEFGLVACRLPSLTLRKGLPCLRQPFFFVFSRFQKQRFGIFLFSAFFVGSKSNVSAVFWLRFRMVWAYIIFFFNGFQQRRFGIFPAAVSQWLGHKTCWGSAFSHARPKHLFLEFGLVACRLPSLTLPKGLVKVCLAWGNLFSLYLEGSKSNVSAFF